MLVVCLYIMYICTTSQANFGLQQGAGMSHPMQDVQGPCAGDLVVEFVVNILDTGVLVTCIDCI